ncbi:MAG: hypothetical protein NC310_02300 [Roseburia sp.]|nr:hypothetical protein [Anaeroplasma bactoclasticum]MCM1195887.1 hypothetical protein [Roseburia sp.]MCM1556232.1 hypothetical protein [Anaeroplasma bactoclasticum]
MKKIKTLLLFFVVGLFLFLGINSNAATDFESQASPLMLDTTSETTIVLGGEEGVSVADKDNYQSEPFEYKENFEYVQVNISSISGNSVYFVLQEYVNEKWIPELRKPGSSIFVNDNLKSDIYLMFCGKDDTNYTNPDGIPTSKVFSVSTNSESRYAIQANHKYRIMIYNPYQWNGKTAYIKAKVEMKNL